MTKYKRQYAERVALFKIGQWLSSLLLVITMILTCNVDLTKPIYDVYNKVIETKKELDILRDLQIYSLRSIFIKDPEPIDYPAMENYLLSLQIDKDRIIPVPRIDTRPRKKYNISSYTDLAHTTRITSQDMNAIINYWETNYVGTTPFSGKGEVFIRAAEESGLDPVYLLAHAALESAWGNSYLGRTRHNYFGIAAFDSNPSAAYHMGDSVDSGIIEGAKWIKANFYNHGCTNLQLMIDIGNYASAKSHWINGILHIMSKSYSII